MITTFLRRNAVLIFCALALVLASCSGSDDATLVAPASPDADTLAPAERTGGGDDDSPVVGDASLDAPAGLVVASTTNDTIELVWDEPVLGGVERYRVIRVAAGGVQDEFETRDAAFSDTGLEIGDVFGYRVVAISGSVESAPSQVVTARAGLDVTPPSRPGRPEVLDTATGQSITWLASIDENGVAGYVLTRVVNGVSEDIVVESDTGYRDNIAAGNVVTYTVRAADGAGNLSDVSRNTTLLTGTASDRVVVVVSAQSSPSNTTETLRLQSELLRAGFTISWFEDNGFDSNVVSDDDTVLLLGDVTGDGFDWNIFLSDATVIGLKSSFIEPGGFLDTPPKLTRVGSIYYNPPTKDARTAAISVLAEPRPVVYLPTIEQIPDLQVWATITSASTNAVAGILPEGAELANGNIAPGCRAFFPGNTNSLAESPDAGWGLLVEFIGDVETACR